MLMMMPALMVLAGRLQISVSFDLKHMDWGLVKVEGGLMAGKLCHFPSSLVRNPSKQN